MKPKTFALILGCTWIGFQLGRLHEWASKPEMRYHAELRTPTPTPTPIEVIKI